MTPTPAETAINRIMADVAAAVLPLTIHDRRRVLAEIGGRLTQWADGIVVESIDPYDTTLEPQDFSVPSRRNP